MELESELRMATAQMDVAILTLAWYVPTAVLLASIRTVTERKVFRNTNT